MTHATRRTNIMTTSKRRAIIRQRKDRNQRIVWFIQDAIGAVCLFGSMYIGAIIAWAFMP